MEQYPESLAKDSPLITLTDSHEESSAPGSRFSVEALGRKLEQKTADLAARLKRNIRESPLEAVGIAAAAGFVARSLPLTSILATSVRVAGGFGPPVLLALGAVKLFENRRIPGRIAASLTGRKTPGRSPNHAGPEEDGVNSSRILTEV
jgi:hypothetical protein